MSELIPPTLPEGEGRREDAEPRTRSTESRLKPPTETQQQYGKASFWILMVLLLIGILFYTFGYGDGFTANWGNGLIGVVMWLVALAVVVYDSKDFNGWGFLVEFVGCLLLIVLGWGGHLYHSSKAVRLEKEKNAALQEKVAALEAKVKAEEEKGVAEQARDKAEQDNKLLQTEIAKLKAAPAPTPVTAGSGDPLKLTSAILGQIERPDAKTIILPKMTGIDFALTQKLNEPGGLLVPPGGGGIVIEEKAGKVHVTSTTNFPSTSRIYMTDGKRAGASELLPPVK